MPKDPVRVEVLTFNCARRVIDAVKLGADIFPAKYDADSAASFVPPDLLVLCLQEIAPIADSFLGGGFLHPYLQAFHSAVKTQQNPNSPYQHVHSHNVGMTAIMVFANSKALPRIARVDAADVGLGVSDMGNKGAAGIRLAWRVKGGQTRLLTFVAAHLAPHETGLEQRIKDWEKTVSRLMFEPVKRNAAAALRKANAPPASSSEARPLLGSSDADHSDTELVKPTPLFTKNNIIIFAGDLNFRTADDPPGPSDHLKFPASPEAFDQWFPKDQLTRILEDGRAFQHLTEFPVTFPPTYKLKGLDFDKDHHPTRHVWAKHRFPSWCDRILFSSDLRKQAAELKLVRYSALPPQPTSDHRPVVLEFEWEQSSPIWEDFGTEKSPYELDADWKYHRDVARNKEYVVGILAYFSTTWDGAGILFATFVGALGSYAILSSLLS